MSRFDDGDGDESYPNAWSLWANRARLALAGRRGKAALQELKEALLALPERRLIANALCTAGPNRDTSRLEPDMVAQGPGVCAVGAYLWHQKVKAGMDPAQAFVELPTVAAMDGNGADETARLGEEAGLAYTLAAEIGYANDETFAGASPEERFDRFLAWIDEQLRLPLPVKPPRRVRRARRAKPATGQLVLA